MVTKIEKWAADDGVEFDTEREAIEYEFCYQAVDRIGVSKTRMKDAAEMMHRLIKLGWQIIPPKS